MATSARHFTLYNGTNLAESAATFVLHSPKFKWLGRGSRKAAPEVLNKTFN